MGQALGGVVNVVTKSGGNAFHGEAGGAHPGRRPAGGAPGAALGGEPARDVDPELLRQPGRADPEGQAVVLRLRQRLLHRGPDLRPDGRLAHHPGGRASDHDEQPLRQAHLDPPAEPHPVGERERSTSRCTRRAGSACPRRTRRRTTRTPRIASNYQGILSSSLFLTAAAGHYRRTNSTEPLSGDYGPPSYFWQDIAQTTNNIVGCLVLVRDPDRSRARCELAAEPRRAPAGTRSGPALSHYWNAGRTTCRWPGYEADPWPGNGFDDGVAITWAAPENPFSLAEYRSGQSEDSTRGFGLFVQDTAVLGRVSLMLGLRADTQEVFNDVGTKVWGWGLGDFLQPRAVPRRRPHRRRPHPPEARLRPVRHAHRRVPP